MFQKTFDFTEDVKLYTPESGYGFITEENRSEQELLQIPEITSGFIPVKMLTVRPIPTIFRADVPAQGNYIVKLEAENDGNEALIFLERRRLSYIGNFKGKKKFTFAVNVCDVIPRDHTEVFEDKSLDIAWIGSGIKVTYVEIVNTSIPTIYIAGDSTVTDQPADYPYSPGTSYSGWGQMLSAFVNDGAAVSNHSHSGLTTETFRNEGHYTIVEKYIKPGDFLLMQFGHNDQKLAHLKEDTGYRENFKRYVAEARSKGAYPVIVTSLARNTWFNSGESYNDLLEAYAKECFRLGEELSVPVVDLHGFSMNLIKENGLEESKKFFYPGDLTHTNDYGAYLMASYVATELEKIGKADKTGAYGIFADIIRKDCPRWEINKELLIKPVLKADEELVADEPYTLKMDRLEEIITNKK